MKELKTSQTMDTNTILETVLPGHPIQIFIEENRAIKKLLFQFEDILKQAEKIESRELLLELRGKFNLLQDIKKHYRRQEELLFPLLQTFTINEVLDQTSSLFGQVLDRIHKVDKILSSVMVLPQTIIVDFAPLIKLIPQVILKEEKEIFPKALEKLEENDWIRISAQSNSYGYCIIAPSQEWQNYDGKIEIDQDFASQIINFSTGRIKSSIFEKIMKNLPIQISFIDKYDNFIYFSPSKNPVFKRTLTSIGRNVHHCHPPKSIVHVTRILTNFKEKKRESEEFWIMHKDKFIYFQYFAIRNKGEYLGTVEMIQDITRIRKIQGEKKLISFAQTRSVGD